MELYAILWKSQYAEKLAAKHGVWKDEVEEVLFGRPHIRFWEKGKVRGEDLYLAYGQTDAGRYLVVFSCANRTRPLSAHDITDAEKRYHNEWKGR